MSSKFSSPFLAKSPLNQDERALTQKSRDTIRVSNKYKPGDLVEEYELEDAIKKQTGKFPQYSVQDYSEVQNDEKGNFVVSLKQNEYFRPGNTDYKN